MICIDCLNINFNRMLLLAVGLWPYQQSKLVRFQLFLFLTILTSCIIFQFTALITSKCTSHLFIKVSASAFNYILLLIKYISFFTNIESIKFLLEELQNIYNKLADENEISIIKKYSSYAKRYTVGLTLIFIFCGSSFILFQLWPKFFNILLFINESRPHLTLNKIIVTEYFVDQKNYFYFIVLHANLALFIGIFTMIATGAMLIVYLQYACGMFRIASYRIEQAISVDTLRKGSIRNKSLTYQKLIRAVYMHREAMRLSDSSVSRFKVMFSLMIVVGVSSASLNFFRIFQVLSLKYNIEEFLLPVISITICTMYGFLGNYVAQKIMDHNNDVFATAYNIQWYTASLNVQKMILFLLQRRAKAFSLNIAGLIVGSMENAAMLLSTEISYFTILYSIQN